MIYFTIITITLIISLATVLCVNIYCNAAFEKDKPEEINRGWE